MRASASKAHVARGWRRRMAAWGALVAMANGAEANGPPDALHYAAPPAISGMRVSPSGSHAVMVWRVKDQPAVAAVIDLAKPDAGKVVGGFARSDVQSVGWVNDDRIHFFAAASDSGAALAKEGDAGEFAVDRTGENLSQLIDWRWRNEETGTRIRSRILPYGWRIQAHLDDGSADIIVAHSSSDNDNDALPGRLARLNTLDGRLQNINRDAPAPASGWLFDGAGEPRVVSVERDGRSRLYWRAPGTESWKLLEDVPQLSDDRIVPLALEADGTLVVATSRGADATSLYSYRPDRRTLDPEAIVSLKGFDVDPFGAKRGLRRFRQFGVAVENRDSRAFAPEQFGDRPANAGPTAGHDNILIEESARHLHSPQDLAAGAQPAQLDKIGRIQEQLVHFAELVHRQAAPHHRRQILEAVLRAAANMKGPDDAS